MWWLAATVIIVQRLHYQFIHTMIARRISTFGGRRRVPNLVRRFAVSPMCLSLPVPTAAAAESNRPTSSWPITGTGHKRDSSSAVGQRTGGVLGRLLELTAKISQDEDSARTRLLSNDESNRGGSESTPE